MVGILVERIKMKSKSNLRRVGFSIVDVASFRGLWTLLSHEKPFTVTHGDFVMDSVEQGGRNRLGIPSAESKTHLRFDVNLKKEI